jgi:DNA-nicking Smr family endonuclease
MTRRRGRPLDPEEEALWATVKQSVRPLRPEPKKAPPPPPALTDAAAKVRPAMSTAMMPSYSPPAPAAKPAIPSLHPLGKRERKQLTRGLLGIDGRLDLHGLRQDEAHARLRGFLAHAQAAGWRLVLVITGKGAAGGGYRMPPESERGVLRRVVPLWLSLPEFRVHILGYEDAHLTHGGGGALYVRIRKRK